MTTPIWSLESLQARCDYWIERLSVGEYRGRVRVIFKTSKFLLKVTGVEAVAGCWWSADECRAEIYLRRDQGETTLLHEILHLVLQGHTAFDGNAEVPERAINRLTDALLSTPRHAISVPFVTSGDV